MEQGRYRETRGSAVYQEQLRRQAIIEEFFRACRAARHATGIGLHSFGQPSTSTAQARPTPACVTLLGLAWPCTQQDVKQAFRSQAKTMHPDAGGSNEAFQTLYKAYQEALALVR
jgi:hypothetical protein